MKYFSFFVAFVAFVGIVSAQRNFTLVTVTDAAPELNAVCLDGTNPAYYWKPALSSTNNWILYIMGGGWCYTDEECLERASTELGSTKYYPANMSDAGLGMFSSEPSLNPDFYNWNMAYFTYCDGASFSGNYDGPVNVSGTNIYYRGHAILTALVQHLLDTQNLNQAENVLIAGCSAGGLSTFLHADYIASMLPSSAVIKAAPDSGYFLFYPTTEGDYLYPAQIQGTFTIQNATGGLNQTCIEQNAQAPYVCMFAEVAFQYAQVPFFFQQSTYDQWQMENIVFPGEGSYASCAADGPINCTVEAIEFADLFHLYMLSLIQNTPTWNRANSGGALYSCWDHCIAFASIGWNGIQIGQNGPTIQQALGDWYFERTPTTPKLIDCLDPIVPDQPTCNPTCPEDRSVWEKLEGKSLLPDYSHLIPKKH